MVKNNFIYRKIILYILLTFSVGLSNVFADNNKGAISGKVTDRSTGQPLPHANIILEGTSMGGTSDINGNYSIINIPVGSYTVKFMFVGYKPLVKTDVIVSSQRTTTLNIVLEESTIEMNEVNVTPDYFEKNSEISTSHKNLEYEEIRRSPGAAEDALRAVLSLPGVTTVNEGITSLIVRGGNGDENLTLIDNIEIYNPFHFAQAGAGLGSLGIISSETINNINFITGGFPALYGDKLSSIYEISIKEGNKNQFAGDVYLNFGGFGGVFDGPLTQNGSYLFTVRRGYFDLITSLMDRPISARYYDGLSKITYDLSPEHRLSFLAFYFQDKFDMSQPDDEEDQLIRDSRYQNRTTEGLSTGINWRYLFSNKGYSLVTAYWTMNKLESNKGPETNSKKYFSKSEQNELVMNGEITYQLAKFSELKTGIIGRLAAGEDIQSADNDTLQTGVVIPAFKKEFSTSKMLFKGGGFMQLQQRLFNRILINAGLRYDYYEYNKEGNLSPRLGLTLQLSEKTTLTASVGQFYQTPALYKISMQSDNAEKLNNSKSTHYVIGAEHLLSDDTKLTAELFYKDMRNLITRRNDPMRILLENENGFAEGLELSIHKKMTNNWHFLISYTYSISKRKSDLYSSYYYADFDKRHLATIEGIYKLSNSWQVGVKFHVASGSPYTPVIGRQITNGRWSAIEGDRNSERYPAYHRLDIRVDKRFDFTNWNLVVYLDLWNVYNRRNISAYYWNDDYSEMKTLYQFSMMPLLGISAEF